MRLRKYGVEATIDFSVYEIDGVDLRVDWTPAQADCEIMKDGGASTQCTNTATDEGSTYSIVLTATEMQAARLVLKVVDAATKVFLDTTVIIETYGNASAQHAFDLDTSSVAQTADHTSGIADIPTVAEFEARSLVSADYVVVGDTIAGVTLVTTTTTNTDMVTGFATEAKQDIIDTNVDSILVDTAEIGAAGAGLTNIGTIATVTDVTNQVTADMTAISGDSTAANNLESQYDETGLAGDTFPATQAQISNITNTGSAVNTPATGYTLTTGTQTANLYTDTKALNGTRHTHTDTGDEMVLEYEFNVGAGIPSSVHITGALVGGNDDLEVMAYDYVTAGYIQIGMLAGKVSSVNEVNSYDIFTSMVGTGASRGEVKIKLQDGAYTLSSATLYIDQIYVSFSSASASYNGFIWYNDTVSNTNTVPGIDGVDTNPVSTWAAALTLSASTNINNFRIANGSTVQLSADSSNFTLIGEEWTLDLNGQIIANLYAEHASVHGTVTGTSYRFIKCKIALASAISVQAGGFNDCALGSAGITLSAAGTYLMKQCSPVNGSVYVDFENAAEAKTLIMTPYNGDVEFHNFGYDGVIHKATLTGQGHITLNANCTNATADDILDIHGAFHITDNVPGGWGGTINEEARYALDYLVDGVWDEVLTASTHNVATSAGRRLRDLATSVILTGTSPDTAGAANTSTRIELDGDSSSIDGAYDPAIVTITAGTGAGQSRQIFEYDGTNKYAYVNRDWKVTPDNTSQYTIIAHSGDTHINEGVAQAGAASTITLNALASTTDDVYNSQIVFLVAGTGADQARRVDDYTGATKIANVTPNWNINPDSTTVYAVLPTSLCSETTLNAILTDTGTTLPAQISALNDPTAAQIATAVLDETA